MMNKIALIVAMLIIAPALNARQNIIESVFQKYSGTAGITNLQICSGMIRMLANMDAGNEDLKTIAASVNSVLILHAPKKLVESEGLNFYNEIVPDLPVQHYDELVRVNNSEQQVLILADESGGVIRELILIVGGSADNTLICIRGNMDMEHLSSLSGISAPGMDHFFRLQK
jgi:hypothetical protein